VKRGTTSLYFDPQDFVHYESGGGRELPVAASTATFEPHLKNCVDFKAANHSRQHGNLFT
jgi:hypothetical protein